MAGQPGAEPATTPIPRVTNIAPPRVAIPAPPRVANTAPPRVATTSNSITAPETIRQLPRIHQRVTRANNPFDILSDDDDEDTVVHSNCSPTQIDRRSNGTAVPPPTTHPCTVPVQLPTSPPTSPHIPTAMPTTFAPLPTAMPTTVARPPPPTMVPPPLPSLPRASLRQNSPQHVPRGTKTGRVPTHQLHTHFLLPTVPAAHDLHPGSFKCP